jgi:hypothetical protein
VRNGRGAARATALAGVLISVPLVLTAACGGGGTSAASSSGDTRSLSQAQQPGAGYDSGSTARGTGSGEASGNTASGSGGSGGTSQRTDIPPSTKDLIITAGIQVKTADAARAAAQAVQITAAAGGYVAAESVGSGPQTVPQPQSTAPDGSVPAPATLPNVNDASDTTQALLVLRVPPQQVDAVLKQLAGKGTVSYQNQTATDVTGQVADVNSRVASAQAAIAELRTMIDKAASMNDLISLEQALAQRESDLESLEAQQKALADQIQYATITVGYYSQGTAAAPPPPPPTGFTRGLTVGWHAFTRTLRAILAAVGWLLPFAGVAAVLWWPVRRAGRLLVRRRQASKPAASEATES